MLREIKFLKGSKGKESIPIKYPKFKKHSTECLGIVI